MRRFRYRSRAYKRNYKSRLLGGRLIRRAQFRRTSTYRARMRRMMRPPRIERKWIETDSTIVSTAQAIYSSNITPGTITQGVGNFQRIGSVCKLLKCLLKMEFDVQPNNALFSSPSQLIRCVVWTPKMDYNTANTYMNTLSTSASFIDRNMVMVLADWTKKFGTNGSIATGAQNFGFPNNILGFYKWYKVFPFPRRIEFLGGATNINQDKDFLYVTVYFQYNTGGPIVNIRVATKTYFVDP